MHAPVVDALLLGAATLGALDALYFILVTYRLVRPDTRLVPNFCRMDEGTCGRIVDDPSARLFVLPNAVYGLAWYLVAAAFAALELGGVALPEAACGAMLAASGLTVLVSAWLAYVLLARLRTVCRLCFLGHALNLAIFVLLAAVCVG